MLGSNPQRFWPLFQKYCSVQRTSRSADIGTMKISARNVLPGTVTSIQLGATTAHVKIDVGGTTVTASITNESVKDLGLEVGMKVSAVVKASDVMVAVD